MTKSPPGHTTVGIDQFPTDPTGLEACRLSEVVDLSDGETFELEIAAVSKRLGDTTVRMLAYNGSIPGPTLRVAQGSEVEVDVVNRGDMDATVHWHGLRLENRYDGTHETQAPIPIGESFPSRVTFPDPGLYWYHPHIREDYGQEMGLYGNVLVVSPDPEYWPPVHREIVLTLDDVLIENGTVAPFSRSETTHTAMGRFGNVLLVAGEPDLALSASLGEIVRFYLMHPAVITGEPGRCPDCGMKLLPAAIVSQAAGDNGAPQHDDGHAHEAAGGIEWEDDMVEVNKIPTPANMRWKLIDRTTGAENHAIAWQFRVGDRVKIRLVNEMDSGWPTATSPSTTRAA